MKKLKIYIATLMVTTLGVSSLSAEDNSFTYVGIGGGYSMINANFIDSDYYINDDDATGSSKTKNYKEDSMGMKVYGGYQFNKIIAVEGSFTDYGTLSSDNYTQKPQAVSIYANAGYSFLNNQLRPFGLLGLTYLQTNQSRDVLDDEMGAIHAGVGVEYYPTALKGFGIRGAIESDFHVNSQSAVNEDETHYSSQSFYKRYALFYVGAQYRF